MRRQADPEVTNPLRRAVMHSVAADPYAFGTGGRPAAIRYAIAHL